MASITQPTAMRPTADTVIRKVQYGATVALGDTLYLDTADNLYKLGDSNDTAAKANVTAIAMTPGVSGGYGIVALSGGVMFIGSTFVVGDPQYVGRTPGRIETSVASTDYTTSLGLASAATQLELKIQVGVAHA
jgi:hypothetical protein